MDVSEKWIDVVTDPLGLAGFALFLVFLVLSMRGDKVLRLVFATLAMASVVGGLALTFLRQEPAPAAGGEAPKSMEQTTHGAGSPAVAGTKGDVSIKIDMGGQETPAKGDTPE